MVLLQQLFQENRHESKRDIYYMHPWVFNTSDSLLSIHQRLLSMFPGEEREYLGSDSLCPTEDANSTQQRIYSPDVLNGHKISGLPNHRRQFPLVICVAMTINKSEG
ncbi:putative DNA helicase Pif1, spo11/DNA topoisomerase VI, subunit A [Helianthus debilis subsp. tardiflorus]